MAVDENVEEVRRFEDWYDKYAVDERDGCLDVRGLSPLAGYLWSRYNSCKREMDVRVGNFDILEKLANNEVVKARPDLPNVSSGETSGMISRMARNLVQNTPNVEVISKFDDDSMRGIFSKFILLNKIISTDTYSNDMQQHLFASTKTALTLGFACVIPALVQDAKGGWSIKYDAINYRDVFPEEGSKDVREATEVFVRRYLTRGEIKSLIRDNAQGWDIPALKALLKESKQGRARESVDYESKKRHLTPDGYAIITWYSNTGEPFLTFSDTTKHLLRIEKNKHPMREHPVHFLVLEKDDQQPLGKSQVEKLIGRQDFQDLMLNGAMKLWYRNINPSILSYGNVNSVPNLGPGKYTNISNPNARIETFEVNTQTLSQMGSISQLNAGATISLVGAADQQMAIQSGSGMSATPQGVDAQEKMVDITTNNYQKAIESFFSHYCSYALTIYFEELKHSVKGVTPNADTRQKLVAAGIEETAFDKEGVLKIDFEDLATEYFVRTVPGSLVEIEDEKQLRILNELFVPLSQAMPALAAVQDKGILMQSAKAMQYIIKKQIELSGATSAKELGLIWTGQNEEAEDIYMRMSAMEEQLGQMVAIADDDLSNTTDAVKQLQNQISLLRESVEIISSKLGGDSNQSGPVEPEPEEDISIEEEDALG